MIKKNIIKRERELEIELIDEKRKKANWKSLAIFLLFYFILFFIISITLYNKKLDLKLENKNLKLCSENNKWFLDYTCNWKFSGITNYTAHYEFSNFTKYLEQKDFTENVLSACKITNSGGLK